MVIEGNSGSIQAFTSHVGTGSRLHDLVFESKMNLSTSGSDMAEKETKSLSFSVRTEDVSSLQNSIGCHQLWI